MIKNVFWSSCKASFILVRLQWHLNFLEIFSKNSEISNFMKILPVGAEVLYMDGQTDMTKLTVVSDNFAKAAKKKELK